MIAHDQHIIDPPAQDSAHERANNRHPPPVVTRTENFSSPTGQEGEQARSEITGRIDRITGVVTAGHTDHEHHSTDR